MKELREMPEFHLYLELHSLSQSIYVFDKNFIELERLLNFLANDSRANSLFWLRNQDKLQEIDREIIRLLHNFVASALSLIDHTRRLYNKLYQDTGHFPDYSEKMQITFANDPLSQFVRDLRRYCQHYKAPDISFVARAVNLQDGLTRSVELPLESLQEFTDWSALAKKYLKGLDSGVDILQIAAAYRNKVIGFYEWFQKRQFEIHDTEINRFRKKESRLLLLQLEDTLDLALANADYRHGSRDDAFLQIFTSKEFDILEQIPPTSIERPTRAIGFLEERLQISEEVKEKIYQLYKFPDLFAPREIPDEEESESRNTA